MQALHSARLDAVLPSRPRRARPCGHAAATQTTAPAFVAPHRPVLVTTARPLSSPPCRRPVRPLRLAQVPNLRTRVRAVALAGTPGRPRGASTPAPSSSSSSSSSSSIPANAASASPQLSDEADGDDPLNEENAFFDPNASTDEDDETDVADDGQVLDDPDGGDQQVALGYADASSEPDIFDDTRRDLGAGPDADENDELSDDYADGMSPMSSLRVEQDDDEQDPSLAFEPEPEQSDRRLAASRRRSRAARSLKDEKAVPVADEPPFISAEDEEDPVDDAEAIPLTNLPEDDVDVDVDEHVQVPDDDDEADLQSAANILSDRGLLGLGVDGAARSDMASVNKFALGGPVDAVEVDDDEPDLVGKVLGLDAEVEEAEAVDEEEEEEEEGTTGRVGIANQKEEEDVIDDDYPDLEDEDEDLRVTTQSSFGTVWELNEDTHVTITEAGESYMYELDEDDQEDQEMSSVRRGKQGGWSGGAMAAYPATDLPEGSREWRARRMYELLSHSSPLEMFRWTRTHLDPPDLMKDLYTEPDPPPMSLGRAKLEKRVPDQSASIIGTMSDTANEMGEEDSLASAHSHPDETLQKEAEVERASHEEDEVDDEESLAALGRAVNFPCAYKFKVEGMAEDEHLLSAIKAVVENKLEREVDDAAFQTEAPDGRYQRVNITVDVEDARQASDLYDALRNCRNVKFSYG